MRIYALKPSPSSALTLNLELLRTLKPHNTPIVVLAVDRTSTLLATGTADGVVKVWDIRGGYVTHTFKGQNVLISALHFFETAAHEEDVAERGRRKRFDHEDSVNESAKRFRLASGSQNGKVRIWDLFKRTCLSTLDSHVSDVRALDYSLEENSFMTASRDKTLILWDASTWKIRKVVPIFEEIEAAGFLKTGTLIFTGGANGRLRLWKTDTSQEITQPQTAVADTERIISAIYLSSLNFILTARADQVLVMYLTPPSDALADAIPPLRQIKRISGTHDEIIDLAYILPDRSLLALATNSEEIRIVSLAQISNGNSSDSQYFGADVAQLTGHEDIIICLDTDWSGHWIVTGSKDNTARLWRLDPSSSSFTCYAEFAGHTESLGAVALPSTIPPKSTPNHSKPLDHPPQYVLTGSQDRTIKRWDVSSTASKAPRARYTRKAHDKDINAIDINHNGQLFASASQDKTVKIWTIEEGEVQGVLRGHRRGVWSVKFAPEATPTIIGEGGPAAGKGLILTGSGDKTLKIWNLSDYSCIRTFEGHTNSVLKVVWLNMSKLDEKRHVQVASAGGDGLVKVWDARTGDAECTLDNHEDRVWALAVNPNTNTIVSGGGDATITFWADTTSATVAATAAAATKFVEEEQQLQNYIHAGSYRPAITLALQLNHPGRLLSLFSSVVTTSKQEDDSLSGLKAVDEILASLGDDQLFTLLLRVRDWNTNARSAPIAQRILWTLMKSYPASRLANLNARGHAQEKSLKEVFDALKAYTERHYHRLEELVDESYLVEYTLREMDKVAFADKSIEPRSHHDADQDMIAA
jgi:U3 small nucleolar RNA-associated protein 13